MLNKTEFLNKAEGQLRLWGKEIKARYDRQGYDALLGCETMAKITTLSQIVDAVTYNETLAADLMAWAYAEYELSSLPFSPFLVIENNIITGGGSFSGTLDWVFISNKPAYFPSSIANVSGLTPKIAEFNERITELENSGSAIDFATTEEEVAGTEAAKASTPAGRTAWWANIIANVITFAENITFSKAWVAGWVTGSLPLSEDKVLIVNKTDRKVNAVSPGTAHNKNFGTTSGTVAEGNDSRIVNAASTSYVGTAISNYDLVLKDGVGTSGDTLQKLFNLIQLRATQYSVANISARDALSVTVGTWVNVEDDGDGNWAIYRAITAGVNATYRKVSDPDLLNAAMTAAQIKASYESNSDTNTLTNALLTKLNGITGTNTGNETASTTGALINSATSKTTPVDADQVGLMDSAASNVLKKLSWANLKAALKSYFDVYYDNRTPQPLSGGTLSVDASLGNNVDYTVIGAFSLVITKLADGHSIFLSLHNTNGNTITLPTSITNEAGATVSVTCRTSVSLFNTTGSLILPGGATRYWPVEIKRNGTELEIYS